MTLTFDSAWRRQHPRADSATSWPVPGGVRTWPRPRSILTGSGPCGILPGSCLCGIRPVRDPAGIRPALHPAGILPSHHPALAPRQDRPQMFIYICVKCLWACEAECGAGYASPALSVSGGDRAAARLLPPCSAGARLRDACGRARSRRPTGIESG